jgi:hypothetical protein
MYDHNQTLVPDSFLALHSMHGRPLLKRDEMERRFELCEDLALHTASFLAAHEQDPDGSDDALRRCHAGLVAEPASVSVDEAAWVIRRVAELQDWPTPAWLDVASPAASS